MEIAQLLVRIWAEVSFLFLAITFLAFLMVELLPGKRLVHWFSERSRLDGAFLGSLLGSATPFGSCSTIPLLLLMIDLKLPFAAIMAFLFSSPVLNPVMVVLLYGAFGPYATSVYVILTFFLSMAFGLGLDMIGFSSQLRSQPLVKGICLQGSCPGARARLTSSMVQTWSLFRRISIYLLASSAIGVLIYSFVPDGIVTQFAGISSFLSIPIGTIIGIPVYMRAETMVPIGSLLNEKGMSVGLIMALTVSGAGASLPEILLLSAVFKRGLLLAYLFSIFCISVIVGITFNIYLS
ncbi:MAG: putative permease [Methanosaeta sp. PtaU1.Bin028]|nr:MAG: putative permease [Methanosaeta sp. PtaU1.Bin028]